MPLKPFSSFPLRVTQEKREAELETVFFVSPRGNSREREGRRYRRVVDWLLDVPLSLENLLNVIDRLSSLYRRTGKKSTDIAEE